MLLAVLIAAATLGCDSGPKRYPVKGVVLIDGQPLTKGYIRVVPGADRVAYSPIGADGTFSLTTDTPNDGCAPGTHPVQVLASESIMGGTAIRYLVPPKYEDYLTSGIDVTVEGPIENLKVELTWDGGQPYVERIESSGDQIAE